MPIRIKQNIWQIGLYLFLIFLECSSYEKTLRKIVRSQSKMVQRPFSENSVNINWSNGSQMLPEMYVQPVYAQFKSIIHKMQRPKISTILSSIDTGRSKSTFSRMNIAKNANVHPYELRLARDAFAKISTDMQLDEDSFIFPNINMRIANVNGTWNDDLNSFNSKPVSQFFPSVEDQALQSIEPETSTNDSTLIIPATPTENNNNKSLIKNIFMTTNDSSVIITDEASTSAQKLSALEYEIDHEKADFFIEESPIAPSLYSYNTSNLALSCTQVPKALADIDAQDKFSDMDIEQPWIATKHFWNHIYESRYETLMRSPKWPQLKVILVPRTHVDTLWKQSFENLHNETVHKIISNIIKKLQFYSNLTFTWNEVSHLSQWWRTVRQKSRTALRRLVRDGRLEITTGAWVETDEATAHLFGIVHQLIEGHQWLQHNLHCSPDVAWLTNSVAHSPTLPYLLSAAGISNLIITNLHFSWQQYLTEYQYTNFIWIQDWDSDRTTQTNLNEALNKFGNDRLPKYSVLSHYLPFNAAGFKACGPNAEICNTEFNFANPDNNVDINSFNVKEKSEALLEQYSKTGTTSSHNVIIAPIGGPYYYEYQPEFDYQYNNYQKIADFVNLNQGIYKASIEFGTTKDYFSSILSNLKYFPSIKGDFLNFADVSSGSPAYWAGYFTTRPLFKIFLRRLQSTLRSTEVLFSFALNLNAFKTYNVSNLFERLINARQTLARLQDRHVVSGTLTAKAIKYAHAQILNAAKNCWYIQERAASLLCSKPGTDQSFLEKYVYREGEFISSFKSVIPGDQIYVFNSLSHERTEIVELITRNPNLRIIDHNKKEVSIQINPIWKYGSENIIKISAQFFKIIFVIVVPPMALELYKIKETYDTTLSAATIYCVACVIDDFDSSPVFPFSVKPIDAGDIQLESYKHRLIFDEYTGFLKSVTEKSTNKEKPVVIDFGAFRNSDHSGMFLFNANMTHPLEDILSPFRDNPKTKIIIIISGSITTEITCIYGKLIQHTAKIFNLMNTPLSNVIKLETKVDYEVSPKNRELELFFSIQTDINNGIPLEIIIDNNGFQYTPRTINITRRVESNIYPMTSLAFIEDFKSRVTVVTDHAQGVTALQEGQLIVILDRRVLYDDGRGGNEGVSDSSVTHHNHYLLLENIADSGHISTQNIVKLPSLSANYLANTVNYILDIYFVDPNSTHLCHFAFMPLVKTSFPCDVSVLNYRAILKRGSPKFVPDTALMTLHRQTFSCRIEHDEHHYCTGESQFNLEKILRGVNSVRQTNLVGTTEGILVNVLNKNNFPPMELTTLRINF